MNNPDDKAVADKVIESIYTAVFNESINGTKSVGSDPTGNSYTGAELNTLVDNMDWTIVHQSSNPNDQAQAATTFASTSLSEKAHIEIRTRDLVGADQANIDFTVAHEIAHATPAGHQIANYVAQAWFQNEGQQYLARNPTTGAMEPTAAYYTAYAASGYHDVNETWANSFGRTIATFDGMGWYHDGASNILSPGYWHYYEVVMRSTKLALGSATFKRHAVRVAAVVIMTSQPVAMARVAQAAEPGQVKTIVLQGYGADSGEALGRDWRECARYPRR